jgi:hypothetical protein
MRLLLGKRKPMALEPDGKDYLVQAAGPDGRWMNVERFESPYLAKQFALGLLQGKGPNSVRVLQVVLVGRRSSPNFSHEDIIGDETDGVIAGRSPTGGE